MLKKIVIALCIVIVVGIIGYVAYDFLSLDKNIYQENSILSPLSNKLENISKKQIQKPNTDLYDKDTINILLLGIDRRSKAETAYRTDIMILVSLNKATNKVVLVSVPRDLWYGGGRINAYYIQNGWEDIQNAFYDITGIKPERYVLTDFEDFSWIVDALGGVSVDVQTTFTDTHYPVDETKEYQTITFVQGPEKLTGERALIFARSRKGDNDNGDWGRMKRQHLILNGMLDAFTQPQSFICRFTKSNDNESCLLKVNVDTLKQVLTTVTTGKMETNLNIGDLSYLWDLYKERQQYTINSIYMDYNYLYTPPMEDYGGAWVLAPINDSYLNFKEDIQKLLTQDIQQTEDMNNINNTNSNENIPTQ